MYKEEIVFPRRLLNNESERKKVILKIIYEQNNELYSRSSRKSRRKCRQGLGHLKNWTSKTVYGHLHEIHLQRPSLYGPPKFEPLAAKPFAANQLAATFYPLTALSLTAGHLKRVTCSKIRHLQQK